MIHPIRHLARITVEAASALSIGSGRTGLENERLVAQDANGLPYLPGSSLAGVIRHEVKKRDNNIDDEQLKLLFGYQEWDEKKKEGKGQGSRVIFSSGMLLDKDKQTVLEGIQDLDFSDPYYAIFHHLPERDHVRINDRGVAEEYAKFRDQLAPKGARFVFEIEFLDDGDGQSHLDELMSVIQHPAFRIGAGTRNGFGELKVISIKHCSLNLQDEEDVKIYLQKANSLNAPFPGEKIPLNTKTAPENGWTTYELSIQPENFFLFGSGELEFDLSIIKDGKSEKKEPKYEVDWLKSAPKREPWIDWSTEKAVIKSEGEQEFILPGTSIKGALSHRVAFHYNRLAHKAEIPGHTIESSGSFSSDFEELGFDLDQALASFQLNVDIDKMNYPPDSPEWDRWEERIKEMSIEDADLWKDYEEKIEDLLHGRENPQTTPVGENNPAVRALFGYAKNTEKEEGQRGKVIIPDMTVAPEKVEEKVFSHVAIDRFTGGAIDGALFEERVIQFSEPQSLSIWVETSAFKDEMIKKAFECALNDLVDGRLALGGNTTKGHGIFSGELKNENKNP